MIWETPPSLLILDTEELYRDYYEATMCVPTGIVEAQCGYSVRFFTEKFDDAFFESVDRRLRDKSCFSRTRAERMPWIEWVLRNPSSHTCQGWDRDSKTLNQRRLSVVMTWHEDSSTCYYAVIIELMRETRAKFITAYSPDPENYAAMMRNRI